jgi:hypothetical protein
MTKYRAVLACHILPRRRGVATASFGWLAADFGATIIAAIEINPILVVANT